MINDTHSEKLDTIWAQLSRQRARGQKDLIAGQLRRRLSCG